MMNHPEQPHPIVTVMTSRDAQRIFDVMRDAASGRRRCLPPGVADVEDLLAIMRGGVAFFIAYIEDQPVGVIGYRWERATLRIFHVAVKEQHQRLGVGRRLVQAVESVGFALGTTNVSAEVGQDGAQLPFERFGYQPADGRGSERVLMSKALRERAV